MAHRSGFPQGLDETVRWARIDIAAPLAEGRPGQGAGEVWCRVASSLAGSPCRPAVLLRAGGFCGGAVGWAGAVFWPRESVVARSTRDGRSLHRGEFGEDG